MSVRGVKTPPLPTAPLDSTRYSQTMLFLKGRMVLRFATLPRRWLQWFSLLFLASSLWIVKQQVWGQPHEHELIAQATIMAERDRKIMERINLFRDDKPKAKGSSVSAANAAENAAALTTTNDAAVPLADDDDSLPTRFTDSIGILARAGKLTPRELRQIDPAVLRVGRVFDHRESFDFNLLESRFPAEQSPAAAAAAAAARIREPAAEETNAKDAEAMPAAAPSSATVATTSTVPLMPISSSIESSFPGSTSRSFDAPTLPADLFTASDRTALLKHLETLTGSSLPNRLDLWAYLPDTNFGEGQLHVLGRKNLSSPEAIAAAVAKEKAGGAMPVNKDGRFVIKPKQALAPDAATGPKPLEWEIVSMSLIFPQAQPLPLSFDLAPAASSFERHAGPAATPAHDDPSSRAAVTRRLAAFWLPSDISLFSVVKGLAYAAAVVYVFKRVKNHPRLNPTDKALSFWCMNAFRTMPSVRQALSLDGEAVHTSSTALAHLVSRPLIHWKPTLALTITETSHEWDRASRFARPIELGGGYYPSADRNNLKLTYTISRGYAWIKPAEGTNERRIAEQSALWNRVMNPTHDRAVIVVEAQRVPMTALFGLLRWRKFKILKMTMTSGRFYDKAPHTNFMYPADRKHVEIKDFKQF